MKRNLLDFAERLVAEVEARGVQVRLESPGRLRLIGKPEVVAEVEPRVWESRVAILVLLQGGPWNWHAVPTDPDDKGSIERWARIDSLRELLFFETWELRRLNQTLVVKAMPPYTDERLQRLQRCVSELRTCWPVLSEKIEHFKELGPEEAREMLVRIATYHGHEGFEILGWDGLQCPEHWPIDIKMNLGPVYVQALECVEGIQ